MTRCELCRLFDGNKDCETCDVLYDYEYEDCDRDSIDQQIAEKWEGKRE